MSGTGALQLVLEASTTAGSVALFEGHTLLGARSVILGSGTADVLYPALVSLCADAGVPPSALTRIVCGEGPGSFTSLRIAASLAKGLAHATNVPLAAVSSLLLAAASDLGSLASGRYVVHADALRQERFAQWVEVTAEGVVACEPAQRVTSADLEASSTTAERLAVLSTPHTLPGRIVRPEANALVHVAARDVRDVPLATWEPSYGRLAEAQVQWEQRHGTALPDMPPSPA